jgi:hypothetical protein
MAERLSAREVRLAQVLNDGLDLFEAVRGFRAAAKGKRPSLQKKPDTQGNRWAGALQALREMAENENIPIVVVGGVATVHHGYERYTKDLDVVVSVQDFDQIVKVCYKYGFDIKSYNPTGMHELLYNGLDIEVLQEGMFSSDPDDPKAMPGPAELGVTRGLQFVPLERWTRLKLSGDELRHDADIAEVIKKQPPERHQDIRDYLQNFNPEYATRFDQLVQRAQQEKQRQAYFLGK